MNETTVDDKKGIGFKEFLSTIKWLLIFNFKLSAWASITQVLTRILLDISPLLNAYIFAKILDKTIKIVGSSNPDVNEIIPLLVILLIYNLANSAINSLHSYVANVMSVNSNYRVNMILAEKINSLGIQTIENPEVVNKIQRARETIGGINNDFERVMFFVSRIVILITTSYVVIKIMPFLVLIIILAVIPELISNRIHMKKDWGLWRSETENRRVANSAVSTLNDAPFLQEITITSSFKKLSDVYNNFSIGYIKEHLKINKSWNFFSFILGSITDIAGIFGYFSILKNLFNKLISIGDTTFQMRALDMFVNNLLSITNGFNSLYERAVKINEIKIVFDMKSMVMDGVVDMTQSGIAPSIVFQNVDFKYPGADEFVIKNLNLNIKPGEKIAIVGENGAGKTTLVKLISRFYKVNSGEILLNNININSIKIDSWYKNLGVLFQDYNTYPYLTLKENIHIGKTDTPLNMEKIISAAKQGNVNSFIDGYKDGYDQILSEKFKGGTRPSTGQWQKIAISRFFYRNSPVVIFDEPTASIDAVSEAEIFGKIYDFFINKTVIIISHRFSTVRNADRIYVVDKGEIVESGSHKELMKLNGKYHNAFSIQAKGYK